MPATRNRPENSAQAWVQANVEAFFGRPMRVENRAVFCLGVVPRRRRDGGSGSPHNIHIWTALLRAVPAIWKLHAALGYRPVGQRSSRPYMDEVWPLDPAIDRMSSYAWQDTMREAFSLIGTGGAKDRLTRPAADARSSGELTTLRLANSILAAGTVRDKPKPLTSNPRKTGKGRTGLVLRRLARSAPDTSSGDWTPEMVEFCRHAQSILTGLLTLDASLGDQQFLVYHDGSRYRLAPFAAFDRFTLDPGSGRERGVPWLARGNLVQSPGPGTPFPREAIEELEALVNGPAHERDFQQFFEVWPQFLIGLGPYAHAHAQLVLRHDDGQRLIPDFFMERLDSDFCDILDLKMPTVELIRHQKNRTRFRSTVMDAVGQLDGYRNWFEDRSNRRAFRSKYGLDAYRPRVVIVIGRRASYFHEVERIQVESQLPEWVDLKTYDDVIGAAKRWAAFV
jgi:hypothetical protein